MNAPRPWTVGHSSDRVLDCPDGRRRHLAKGETCVSCGANVDEVPAELLEREEVA